jgi:hypothetical protein
MSTELREVSKADLSDAELLRAVEELLTAAEVVRRLFKARAAARCLLPTWADVDEAVLEALQTGRICDVE